MFCGDFSLVWPDGENIDGLDLWKLTVVLRGLQSSKFVEF